MASARELDPVTALVKPPGPCCGTQHRAQSARGWGVRHESVPATSAALCSGHAGLPAPRPRPARCCLRAFARAGSAATTVPSSSAFSVLVPHCSGLPGGPPWPSRSLSVLPPVRFSLAPRFSPEVIWFWGSFSDSASDALREKSSLRGAVSASLTAPRWNAAQMTVYRSLEGLGLGAKSLVTLDKSPPHAEPASSSIRWS